MIVIESAARESLPRYDMVQADSANDFAVPDLKSRIVQRPDKG